METLKAASGDHVCKGLGLSWESEKRDGGRIGEGTKGRWFLRSGSCLKMERSQRRKGQREKNCGKMSVLGKEGTFSCTNNMDNIILPKCFSVLYLTGISYYKNISMLYKFIVIFLGSASQTFLQLHFSSYKIKK